MNSEILIAENVEINIETLESATDQRGNRARWDVLDAVIKALDPEDRKRLEAHKNGRTEF